jgi:hypothetical protein
MRTSTFFPFGAPPIANLEKRVAMQRAALAQAEADLAEARGERATAELDEPAEAPSPYISNEHRRMRAADETRRRGLGPEPTDGVIPSVPAIAQLIVAADRKRRGFGPVEEPAEGSLAARILAADRKARGEL